MLLGNTFPQNINDVDEQLLKREATFFCSKIVVIYHLGREGVLNREGNLYIKNVSFNGGLLERGA